MHSKRLISRLQSIGKIPPKQKRDAHDLLTLFHAMPGAIRVSLALNSQEHSFERYRYVFTSSRYQYESARVGQLGFFRSSIDEVATVDVGLRGWLLQERGSLVSFVLGYIAEAQARSAAQ